MGILAVRCLTSSLAWVQKRPTFLAITLGGRVYWIPETGMVALRIGTRGIFNYHFTGTFEDGYVEFVQVRSYTTVGAECVWGPSLWGSLHVVDGALRTLS